MVLTQPDLRRLLAALSCPDQSGPAFSEVRQSLAGSDYRYTLAAKPLSPRGHSASPGGTIRALKGDPRRDVGDPRKLDLGMAPAPPV